MKQKEHKSKKTKTTKYSKLGFLKGKLTYLLFCLVFLIIFLVVIFFTSIFNYKQAVKNLSVPEFNSQEKKLVNTTSNSTAAIKLSDAVVGSNSSFCLNVPVLFYHHVEPLAEANSEGHAQLTVDSGVFEAQLNYLKEHHYTTITAEDLVQDIIQHKTPDFKSVVITLDDGYDDMYQYAFPLAKKYNVILNLMISTGLLGNNDYLTWDQLKEMVSSGLVEAYDHTVHHTSVGNLNNDKTQQEVLGAKTALENNLGKPVDIFTYPYGSYSQNAISLLQQDGFLAAFTTAPGTIQCENNLMYLNRTRIGNSNLSSYGLR